MSRLDESWICSPASVNPETKPLPYLALDRVGTYPCNSCCLQADFVRIGRLLKHVCQHCGHTVGLTDGEKRKFGFLPPKQAKR